MSDIQKDRKDVLDKRTEANFEHNFNGFVKNEHHKFSVLKSEKLASALYLVTGFMSDTDPLRNRLRTCALDLVSSVSDTQRARANGGSTTFISRCLEIGSLLALAERTGAVSPMNTRILSEEYAALGSFVDTNSAAIFSDRMIDVSARVPAALPAQATPAPVRSFEKRTENDQERIKKTNNYKRHSNRRDTILSLFNKKDVISVKDASESIEGCSEKTVQRELMGMVDEGVLLMEGKRRWTVYRKAPLTA